MDTRTIHPSPEALNAELQRTILREAVTRFNDALMDDEERILLRERIIRLRRALGIMR